MEVPRGDRRPAPRSLLVVAAVSAVITALCIVTIDQPIARWLGHYEAMGFWDRGIDLAEWIILLPLWKLASVFALVIGMLVTIRVPRWRGQAHVWMWLAAVHLISRFLMIHIKTLTGRLRPTEWLARGGDTFWREDGISFPSGHVVLFASLVIPIVVLWPRTRPLLALIAFAMLARLAVNAHFVSDVTGAVALVALVAWSTGHLVRPLRR